MHINSTTEFFSSWNFLSSALRNIRIRSNWEISVLPGFVVFVVRHDCCVANSTTNCKIEKQNLIRLSLFSQIHIYFYYWSHWRASKSAHKIVVNNRSRVLAIFRQPYIFSRQRWCNLRKIGYSAMRVIIRRLIRITYLILLDYTRIITCSLFFSYKFHERYCSHRIEAPGKKPREKLPRFCQDSDFVIQCLVANRLPPATDKLYEYMQCGHINTYINKYK